MDRATNRNQVVDCHKIHLIVQSLIGRAGLVLGREQLDRRMRTVDDVSELKQPMLVSLPVSAHARRALPDTSRTRLMKQRVLTGLPRPT